MLKKLINRIQLFKRQIMSTTLKIGPYLLHVPPKHALPDNLKKHLFYDRFLPILASCLPEGMIIDVGANIGDSAIAMATCTQNKITAIEGASSFFNILKYNVSRNHLDTQIFCKKHLVGNYEAAKELRITKGTAQLVDANTHIQMDPLDHLIAPDERVVLIKTDTDGFDHTVLLSGLALIQKQKPILFWENEMTCERDLSDYRRLYTALSESGYTHFYLFDNFGQFMCHTSDISLLSDISQYTYFQMQQNLPRTIYYTDIMAVTEDCRATAELAIKKQKAEKKDVYS